jgi:hypothetical protein
VVEPFLLRNLAPATDEIPSLCDADGVNGVVSSQPMLPSQTLPVVMLVRGSNHPPPSPLVPQSLLLLLASNGGEV